MEKSAFQLQRFMDAALSSCKDNAEEVYFMIVRIIEVRLYTLLTEYKYSVLFGKVVN